MTSTRLLALISAAALALGACATDQASAPAASSAPVSGTISEQTATVTATVESVDLTTRLVKLRGPEGQVVELTAGPEVKNLPQVKQGDLVNVGFHESLVYEVRKPGEATLGTSTAAVEAAAEPGEKPGAAAMEQVTVTTRIQAIDKSAPSVTLETADGQTTTVKVKDPAKLERVAVGDLVEITYSTAVAVFVEPATAPAK